MSREITDYVDEEGNVDTDPIRFGRMVGSILGGTTDEADRTASVSITAHRMLPTNCSGHVTSLSSLLFTLEWARAD